jgi:hypothetical protein
MESRNGRQVLAMKYIVRRIVALLVVAVIVAIPAVFGAYSFERDKDDNHNPVGSEANELSYSQVEPHVRTYIDEEKLRVTSEGAIVGDEASVGEEPEGDGPSDEGAGGEAQGSDDPASDVPVYDTPASVPDVAVGTVLIYAGDKVPDGFLLCDGREVPRGRYSDLYKAIGEKYGEGDGVTTFNLPDMNALDAEGSVGALAEGAAEDVFTAGRGDGAGYGDGNGYTVGFGFGGKGQLAIPAEYVYALVAGGPRPDAAPAGAIAAEYAFEQTIGQPGAGPGPAYKASEPTGPPPVVDLDKENRYDEPKPDSSPPTAGAAPTMYFIIKY